MDKTYDYIVLGAGIAGLCFAYKMSKQGFHVLVLEKDNQIGGLSKTIRHNDFLLDYSAHRFHSANPEVLAHVRELMKDNFVHHTQKSRMFMFGCYLKYPFELQNLLRAMPKKEAFLAAFDFLSNIILRRFRKPQLEDYQAWFIYHFGKKLYRIMCEPYTSKIWKNNPALISADWADQRFQGPNLTKFIKRIFKKIITLNFSSYSLSDENLAPDGGEFYYPEKGIQQICDRYQQEIVSCNGEVLVNSEVYRVDVAQKRVNYFDGQGNKKSAVCGNLIISTIPLHMLYSALEQRDLRIEAMLKSLKYMNIIFVYLFLDRPNVSRDHWLYFSDPNIIFNRSVEFKNWSSAMAPIDKTAICLDITCFDENKSIWLATEQELTNICIEQAEKIKLIKKEEVFDSLVIKVKNAYPYYDLDYKEKLSQIVEYLQSNRAIYCLGRTGIFKYNNSDGSIEMATALSDQFLRKKNINDSVPGLLNYNFKNISY